MPKGMILTFSGNRSAVKVGILHAMIRKAGLTEEQFLELLGRKR
jgi:hypothetical protein